MAVRNWSPPRFFGNLLRLAAPTVEDRDRCRRGFPDIHEDMRQINDELSAIRRDAPQLGEYVRQLLR